MFIGRARYCSSAPINVYPQAHSLPTPPPNLRSGMETRNYTLGGTVAKATTTPREYLARVTLINRTCA